MTTATLETAPAKPKSSRRSPKKDPEFVTVIYSPYRDVNLARLPDNIPPLGSRELWGEWDEEMKTYDSIRFAVGVNQDIPFEKWKRFIAHPDAIDMLNERRRVLVIIHQKGRAFDNLGQTYSPADAETVIENCNDLGKLDRWLSVATAPALLQKLNDRISYLRNFGGI